MAKQKESRAKKTSAAKQQVQEQAPKPTYSVQQILLLLVFLFGMLLYINTGSNEYAVDDTIVIIQNDFTKQGTAGLKSIFTTDAFEGHFGERGKTLVAGGRYRPLSIATFAIEQSFFGSNHPGYSHIINALLYGATGVMIFLLLGLLFPPKPDEKPWQQLALWVSLLYLAHPIHTEAVANIKGRDEVLGMLFSMSALYFAVSAVKKQQLLLILPCITCYFLALLSKENAITFLAITPLTLFLFTKAKLKDYALVLLPMLLCAGVFLLLRRTYTGSSLTKFTKEIMNDPFVYLTTSERYGTLFYTYLTYLKLLFFPLHLTHDYYPHQVPNIKLSSPTAILSILVNVGLIIYGLIGTWRKDKLAYGILFYYISFSVVSQLFFTVGTNMNERFIYMPSFGFAVVLGILLYRLSHKIPIQGKNVLLGILAVMLVLGSLRTISRNTDWKNDFTLFRHDVNVSTNSAKLNMAYGGVLIDSANHLADTTLRKEWLREAITHLQRSINIYGDTTLYIDGDTIPVGYANAYNLLGNAYYFLDKKVDSAEYAYRKAMYYIPMQFDATQNLSVILTETGRYTEAIPLFRALINTKPTNATFSLKMGECYKNTNNPDSAIFFFQRAANLDPGVVAEMNYQIGVCYGRYKNDIPNSIKYLSLAVQQSDQNLQYKEDLGVAYAMSGNPAQAVTLFRSVLAVQPSHRNVLVNMRAVYQALNRPDSVLYYQAQLQHYYPQ